MGCTIHSSYAICYFIYYVRSAGKYCDCENINQKRWTLDHIQSEMNPSGITRFLHDPFRYKCALASLCLSGPLTLIIS
jgi:hypothetical protein